MEAGGVATAIESESGKIYTGVCVDGACTLGICAERNAIFNMITNGESAVRPSKRNRGEATEMLKKGLKIAKELKIDPVLCVCDNDNYPSEKVIIKNGGVFENEIFDPEENVTVKRYRIKAE